VAHTSAFLFTNESKDFLRTVGLARPDGELYTNQRKKFREVAAMVEQLAIVSMKITKRRTVAFLDCACGKSYVAFALNYILTRKLNRSVQIIGVDKNPQLIHRCIEAQRSLGYENMEFHAASIVDFVLDKKPDVTYCLHACDTATDEAIAKGIVSGSRFIVAVPCCQREVSRKMRRHPLTPLTQFPLIKERLSSLVTDSIRALVLSAAGYKVEVFEFTSSKVTPKNLMLRAEKTRLGDKNALKQYWRLRKLFSIEPKMEEYLVWLRP